ncbi:MAG: hypothetical protein JWO80_1335 [Bryobacterales bacterium]|nr:hypothetical protein [Bryobacterales bacterium]
MRAFRSKWPLFKSFRGLASILTLLFVSTLPAVCDFWSIANKGQPDTVKLVRQLPPVSARNGRTVSFQPEIAGNSIPTETATILREKISTLLLNSKAGAIQLVDGPADTVIKCIVTGYEPKTIHPGERKVGMKDQKIQTWVGNIEASVHVLDSNGQPIDAANLKHHLENDFVVSEQEQKAVSLTDKRASWRDKVAGGLRAAKGGGASDLVSLAGGGQQIHNALGADSKGGRPPTDIEWRGALIEGLAAKVANRIVPVGQEFVAVLPVDKEFAQIRELAKNNRWGDVQEATEKMSPLAGANEAFRQYMLGLSYEAIAYQEGNKPEQAAELLNKSSKYYDNAHQAKSGEREIFLSQIRVQDSLDHYLEIQHYLQNRAAAAPLVSPGSSQKPAKAVDPSAPDVHGSDNAALIEMVKVGMAENVLVTFVRTAPDPKFDASAGGLLQLGRAKVTPAVIEAVQKRMSKPAAPQAAPRSAPPRSRPVPPSPPLQ